MCTLNILIQIQKEIPSIMQHTTTKSFIPAENKYSNGCKFFIIFNFESPKNTSISLLAIHTKENTRNSKSISIDGCL